MTSDSHDQPQPTNRLSIYLDDPSALPTTPCPRCSKPIEGGADLVACGACMIPHHASCWAENSTCAKCPGKVEEIEPVSEERCYVLVRDAADSEREPLRMPGAIEDALIAALDLQQSGLLKPVIVLDGEVASGLRVMSKVAPEELLRRCAPAPFAWWVERTGVVVLAFLAHGHVSAKLRASVAAICMPADFDITIVNEFEAPAGYSTDVPESDDLPSASESVPDLVDMGREFIHWAHARIVLKTHRPNLDERILEALYRVVVQDAAMGAEDPRAAMVFDRHLAVVRGQNGWLHAETLTPMKQVSKGALRTLPWALDLFGTGFAAHPMKVEVAGSTAPLPGYVPIRPVRGAVLRTRDDQHNEVVVEVQPRGEPVRLLDGAELIGLDLAFSLLEGSFPGLNKNYLLGLLAGAACAEIPTRPVMLFVTGPSGSGKGETCRLAASFLGDDLPKVNVNASDDHFAMQIGSSLEEGRRLLLLDEVGKVQNKARLVRRLLEISTAVTWRPLYVTGSATTPTRAMLVLAHLSVPAEWCASPEFVRRVRAIRLGRSVPRWEETCGGDSASWRSRSAANARIANSLLTHAVRLAEKHDFDWDSVADALGIGRPDVEEADRLAPIALYRHCRNEDGKREFFATGRFKDSGWVDLRSRGAAPLLDGLLAEDTSAAWDALKHRLESLDWNKLLLIEETDIVCEVRFHGRQRALRFRSPGARGHWMTNEQLPAARNRHDLGGTDGSKAA